MRLAIMAGAVALGLGAAASAAPIGGGTTSVTFTDPFLAALGSLGLVPSAPGPASSLVGATATFDISGGDTAGDMGAPLIEHDGARLSLAAGATSITVGNFDILAGSGILQGDVIGASLEDVPLFALGAAGADGILLSITAELAGALDATFGADDADGDEFGLTGFVAGNAVTEPSVVPAPAGLPLAALGLGALALLRRRRA